MQFAVARKLINFNKEMNETSKTIYEIWLTLQI
jgi:hypothetical protein